MGEKEIWRKSTWNLKHLFINGCFNWMIPNLYIGNGCFTKHPFKTGCLGYQAGVIFIRQKNQELILVPTN